MIKTKGEVQRWDGQPAVKDLLFLAVFDLLHSEGEKNVSAGRMMDCVFGKFPVEIVGCFKGPI